MSNNDLIDSDVQYKRAHHQKSIRAAFYWYTGEVPRLAPGDLAGARAFLQKLQEARHVCKPLTSSEHSRLTKLITKWTARANGTDPRFMVKGTRRGALTNQEKERLYKLGWTPNSNRS